MFLLFYLTFEIYIKNEPHNLSIAESIESERFGFT